MHSIVGSRILGSKNYANQKTAEMLFFDPVLFYVYKKVVGGGAGGSLLSPRSCSPGRPVGPLRAASCPGRKNSC